MIDFAAPWVILLLPLPWIVQRLLPPRRAGGASLLLPDRIGRNFLRGAKSGPAEARSLARHALWAVWVLALLALSGPRDLAPVSALKVSGRDLAIALDLSGSMVRDDFDLDGEQITRLEAVKHVGAEFARGRGGDRVALIVFGSEAYYASPFTFDVEAVARRIEEAAIGISGRATNISDGLGLALKRMQSSQAATRVVILLSDGANNAGAANPRGVAELAASLGIRVHTIALGPKDLETAEEGERGVVDAATLRAIAQISGGESFRVRTTEDLAAVAEALDRLEATDSDGLAAELYRDYWIWPAMAAGLILAGLAWRQEA
ncbi:Ca-activated chloride channel family protein [Primorskyibacter sedentarius]|uniref:Ca-activated chloride channel family protein n=1 Tax=Primorskyibacter sedentarius TaxID=745311 RepID=A0A4R3JF87_9RHOB|nr:VWA domain-containing protein [Primorskyibacter sedentarius]TCS64477.1 Ca-activated chloride channel family protein [Primorskyibacter sedentarius]